MRQIQHRRRRGNDFSTVTEEIVSKSADIPFSGKDEDISSSEPLIDAIHADIISKYFTENDEKRAEFERDTAEMVDVIRKYENGEVVTSIGQKIKQNHTKFLYLSSYYNLLARRYNIIIPAHSVYSFTNRCEECHVEMPESNCDYDESVCGECFNRHDVIQNKPTFVDKSSIASSKNAYIEQELPKAIQYVQGKIGSDTIPEKLFEMFTEYCADNNINIADVRPQQAKVIFKEIGYKNYDHIYRFLNTINDYPLIVIPPEYEYLIKLDNILFMQEYEKIKGNRSSSPNSYFKLMLFLRRHKFDIPYEDLKIPTLQKTLTDLYDISREVFSRLGWEIIEQQ